ncbi:cuticle protein 14-like [Tachypleus tridentatus]|uniref:cuticle protein 14-like n=1 Tax=Tachypleus tridentatus TaxID=6853 RepID=UPI003FD2B586
MKVLILCALVAATQAGIIYAPGVLGTGASTRIRNQDVLGNYNFAYDEGSLTGGSFRKESGDALGNVKIGSYGLRTADGRIRTVNYVADAAGFRTDIDTNEPGVEAKDPASASINKVDKIAVPLARIPLASAPAAVPLAATVPVRNLLTLSTGLPLASPWLAPRLAGRLVW